jgi:integrase
VELVRRFERENDVLAGSVEAAWPAFLSWLTGRKSDWSASTWRQYKAAAIHAGIRLARQHSASISDLMATLSLSDEGQAGTAAKGQATSAHKHKRFPIKDLSAILDHLQGSTRKDAEALRVFLRAGVVAGLRPIEWTNAEILQERGFVLVLKVENAKDTHGRSHGQFRHLRWRTIGDDEHASVLAAIAIARKFSTPLQAMDKFTKALQRLLRETCQTLWPRRKNSYALYDCRHDFAARAKLAYEPEGVAALLGHASDETATRHYGRSRTGSLVSEHAPPLPEPDPVEVLRVRHLLESRMLKLEKERIDRWQINSAHIDL